MKFISQMKSLCFTLQAKGRDHYISFVPKGKPWTHGYSNISDPDVIEAIKKHPMFGSVITIEESEKPQEEKAEKVPTAVFENVKKTQDAKKILKAEPYNIDETKIINKEDALRFADELNISFPNLK